MGSADRGPVRGAHSCWTQLKRVMTTVEDVAARGTFENVAVTGTGSTFRDLRRRASAFGEELVAVAGGDRHDRPLWVHARGVGDD